MQFQENKKLMVIGLDGAPYAFIKRLIDEGKLPNFRKLRDGGVSGTLKSTFPSLTCPAIPCFYTGKNPGKTGVFDFRKWDGSIVSFYDVKDRTVWDYLGDSGIKSLIFNVGITSPAKPLNGVMVSDFNIRFAPHSYTYPENIKKELGDIDVSSLDFEEMIKNRFSNPDKTLELLEMYAVKYFGAFIKLFKNGDYPFTIFWLAETDTAWHWLAHRIDLIERLYIKVDELIGKLISEFPGHDFMVISDHGISLPAKYRFHLNKWLAEKGYLVSSSRLLKTTKIWLQRFKYDGGKIKNTALWFKNLIVRPQKKQDKSAAGSGPMDLFSYLAQLSFDKNKSTAFLAPFNKWGIYLNKGQRDIVDKLIAELKEATYKGQKVFKHIWRKEEVFLGSDLSLVPDICFVLSDNFSIDKLFGFSTFRDLVPKEMSGDHLYAPDGIFFAKGSGFTVPGNEMNLSLLDLMPLILNYFGVDLPADIDGKMPENLLL